jgi:hypothetical protein
MGVVPKTIDPNQIKLMNYELGERAERSIRANKQLTLQTTRTSFVYSNFIAIS